MKPNTYMFVVIGGTMPIASIFNRSKKAEKKVLKLEKTIEKLKDTRLKFKKNAEYHSRQKSATTSPGEFEKHDSRERFYL